MKTEIKSQDDVLRVRDDNEIHGAIIHKENRYELTSVERDVKFVDDAVLTFTLGEKYTIQRFEKLTPIDYSKIPDMELTVLRAWFDRHIKEMLPTMLSYAMSKENLLKLKDAVQRGVPIIIKSGVDTDHSHILVEKELFGL